MATWQGAAWALEADMLVVTLVPVVDKQVAARATMASMREARPAVEAGRQEAAWATVACSLVLHHR